MRTAVNILSPLAVANFTIIRYYCAAIPLKLRCDFLSLLKEGQTVNVFVQIFTLFYTICTAEYSVMYLAA